MPMIEQPSISPDGKNIAAIFNGKDTTQVVVTPFGSKDLKALVSLGGEKYRIENVYWANDERLIITVSQPYENKGLKLRINHIYSADIEGKNVILR